MMTMAVVVPLAMIFDDVDSTVDGACLVMMMMMVLLIVLTIEYDDGDGIVDYDDFW